LRPTGGGRFGPIALTLMAGSCAPPPSPQPVPAPLRVEAAALPPVASYADHDFALSGRMIQGGLLTGTAPADTRALVFDGKPIRVAPDGRFIIGLDRDHPASALIEATLDGGRGLRQRFAIAPREWDIQSLPTLPRGTTPTPEFVRRRAAEQAMIAAARAINPATDGWRQTFRWPVTGRVSGHFGSQRIYAGEPGAYHSGTDIARGAGTPVAAPADGVVILASPPTFSIEGNLLLIDHGMGLNSAFLHLSRIDVKAGDRVRQGQVVGAIGMTGRATGPHLHWGLKWNEARIDPELLVAPMR